MLRVQLDYELKEKLYRKLGKSQTQDDGRNQRSKVAFARELHLPVVNGKVAFPDLRIEYANQEMEISRVDLELATGHYHAEHLAEKARAGFQIYARPEDAPGLRRVWDEREIMTAIKVAYFCRDLGIARFVLPSKHYAGAIRERTTARYFVDKFPMIFSPESSSPPVVTFSFVDPGLLSLASFDTHLFAYGTLLHAQGTPLKVAQAQLGHSHMATTLEVYTHASGSAQRYAVNMLADQLFPNVPKLDGSGNTAQEKSQVIQ